MQLGKIQYLLQSISSDKIFEDQGWSLDAVGEASPTHTLSVSNKLNLLSKT